MSVAEAVADIRRRMAGAARAVGRDPDSVRLVAVCKRQSIENILAVVDAGIDELGENTAQGMQRTASALEASGRSVRWHFVGTLQRNKVAAVLEHARTIHSVDRLPLAEAIAKRAPAEGVNVLLQVNVGREAQKGGVEPESTVELAQAVARQPRLRLVGLMTIPPADAAPAQFFEELARLRSELKDAGVDAPELSMGMSEDFETAIRCGATIVRVGTALFGARSAAPGRDMNGARWPRFSTS
jgi:PLP dependent protein